jgi:hypothetical protein
MTLAALRAERDCAVIKLCRALADGCPSHIAFVGQDISGSR